MRCEAAGVRRDVRFFILMFVAATRVLGADVTRWGPVESGLQLGIDVAATSAPTLRISLKNAGTEPRDLVIGYETSAGTLYNIEFTAQGQGLESQPVFDLNSLKDLSSSYLQKIAHLPPGEVREFVYPLNRLISVVNRKDVPFRALWERGYAVRASFEFPFARLTTPDLALHQ
jgi:hypothetical protein